MTSPGEKTAPGALELIRSFLNTSPRPPADDSLAEPGALRGWLADHDLMASTGPLDLEHVERVLGFRQALLGIVPTAATKAVSSDAVTALNHLASRSLLVLQLDDKGNGALQPAREGVEAAMASLLSIVYTAMVDGTWRRMKRCANRRCRRVFYDNAKNGSGRWHSMEACGNVANARAYRKRQKAAG